MSDDEISRRDQRRQHYEKTKPKVQMSDGAKRKLILWSFIGLLVVAIGAGMYFNQAKAGDCPGHWHSTYHVYVDDEMISYQHPAYDLGRNVPLAYHLHQPNGYQIHWEPPRGGCEAFETFLNAVDTDISDGRLVLDGGHADLGQAGTYTDDGNRTLQLWHAPHGDDWETISASSLNGRQLQNGERVLILFGDYTPERVAELQEAVPYASGTTPEGHPSG